MLQILTSESNFTLPCIVILRYCWIRFSLCLIPCNKSINANCITLFWKIGLALHWIFFCLTMLIWMIIHKLISCYFHHVMFTTYFWYQVHWILYLKGIFKYLLQTQHLLNMYIGPSWMRAKLESKVHIDLVGFVTY